MTPTRTWSAGAAVVGVLLVLAGWFLLISPERSHAADLRDQVSAQEASNEQIALKTKQLQAQFASLPARQAQLAEIKQQMPDNPALPSLIRDLSSFTTSAGVTLQSVTPGEPVAALPPSTGQAGVTAPGQQPAAAGAAQLKSIPTTVTVSGTYSDLTLYLQKLQTSMRRAFLVQSIQLAENKDSGGQGQATSTADKDPLLMTVMGDIFILGDAPAAPAQPVAPTTTTSAS